MYKYGPRRGLKSKYNSKNSSTANNNYMKMYNLELETINPNSIISLQNKIGNKATEKLLEELSMTNIVSDGKDKAKLVVDNKKSYNNQASATSDLSKDLRFLLKEQSNNASDVLVRNMNYDENKQIGRIKLKSDNIDFVLRNLSQLAILLRVKDFSEQNKALEIKNADKMLNNNDKTTIEDVEVILNMIKNLPKYNNDDETIGQYMKVFNLLCNTGINMDEFLSNNGQIDMQKKMLYYALGAKRASK